MLSSTCESVMGGMQNVGESTLIVYIEHCRLSSKGGPARKIYILNKNIVHLVDDFFWYMGFKTNLDAERVNICIICIILFLFLIHCVLSGPFRARYSR
jgi:hypothetical protein